MPDDAKASDDATIAAVSAEEDRWRGRNRHYYQLLTELHQRHIPPGARVLEIGCRTGELLASLEPSVGVGVDDDAGRIAAAKRRHPELTFVHASGFDLACLAKEEPFDFIIVCNVVGELRDVQALFASLHPFCGPDTRVIVSYHNAVWEPVLSLASRLGKRRPVGIQNWLSRDDLANLLMLAGFAPVRQFCEVLLPLPVPLLARFANNFLVKFWPWRHAGLQILEVARPQRAPFDPGATRVSVIVPTRNERGNVESAISRTPEMGAGTEIIFVDGWSTDGTQDEIRRCIEAFPDRAIRFIPQEGPRGKGQAVRQGFDAAKGEVLMILDADLTVAPEDLPKFFDALASGKGEFVNGTRLVYPMENQAMRFLNKCGNRFFSALFTWLIGQRFRDTLCGTKVLTRRNYRRIAAGRAYFGEIDPFGDFDLIFGAAKCDLAIIEVPVRYGARTYGETNISRFRDGWLLLRMSAKAFWKLRLR